MNALWNPTPYATAGIETVMQAVPLSVCGETSNVVFGSDTSLSAEALPVGISNETDPKSFSGRLISPSLAQLSLILDTEGTWQLTLNYWRPSGCGSGDNQDFPLFVLPGCANPEQSHLDMDSLNHELPVPCSSTQGEFYIAAIDSYGNQLDDSAHSCANFSVSLVGNGLPTVTGKVSWSDEQVMFQATYLAQQGGEYALWVLLDGQPISGIPQQVLFVQPSASKCTLDCSPANSTFHPDSSVRCEITYRDQRGVLLSFCPDSLTCTQANVTGPASFTNASMSALTCSSQTAAQFDWQLGGYGTYTVNAFVLGSPLTPFHIVVDVA